MATRSRRCSILACLLFAAMATTAPRAAALPADDSDPFAASSADPTAAPAPAGDPDLLSERPQLIAPGALAPARAHARPSALFPLYASFATLQALDAESTYVALRRGAREGNAWTLGASGSPAAFMALKAAGTAAVFVASERLWKTHRATSVFMMLGIDAAYVAVAAHNYRVAASTR